MKWRYSQITTQNKRKSFRSSYEDNFFDVVIQKR